MTRGVRALPMGALALRSSYLTWFGPPLNRALGLKGHAFALAHSETGIDPRVPGVYRHRRAGSNRG
jgi:hypothetical protein